ncbi:hypothetical protein HELRODRAFT_192637 [Helobdella robusta]|uniref:EGF-like domain-containing protein n=1 Tax=Helobdella robusta TaxID=6412 RepID=T1FU54_HELRO|nr:hypothetical protein HELRODRAFT_192637 [Helobdella robusta]ESO00275.1 hypothetical protein HELRODRAFT_192637 [Helobdella robusta]
MRLVLNLVLVVSYFAVLMKSKLVCINDSFMCDNSCKPNFWLCDGVKDCADGRDESDCNPPQCNEHEFSCNTGKKTCLRNILMCNGQIDCPDGSDEDYCEKTSTNECYGDNNGKSDGNIFKCASNSKKCIPIKWRCDHHNDCSDGSDELNCSLSLQQALSGQGVLRIPGKYAIAEGCCRKIQNGLSMVLRLGTLNPLPKSETILIGGDLNGHVGEKTDGLDNVHGGFGYGERNEDGNRMLEFAESHGFCLLNTYFRKRLEHFITYKSGPSATQIDFFAVKQQHRKLFKNVKVIPGELSYTGKCEGKNMWTCADGKCIIKSKRCDGRMDCFDKSDELNCPAPLSSLPSSPSSSSHQRCFGDEGTSFVCTLSGECLRKEWVCDGAADCLDASDEDNCPTVSCNGTLMGVLQHLCANKLHCIDPRQVCDGIKQCRDGSDERDCKQECSIDEFSCSSLAKLKSLKAKIHESNDNIKDNIPKKDDGSDKDVSGNDERTELIRKDSCLPLSKMCDAVKDCANGEDEDEAICSSDQSEVCVQRNGGCSDECQSNKFFHRCLCPSGYKLSDDFKTCQDIDECASSSSNTCAHLCANTPGSYTCSCHPGYILDNVDNATCIQIGVEAVMLFSTQDDIRRFSLHSGKYEPIVMDAINNLAFDFNIHDKTLYFVNPSLAGRKDELTRLRATPSTSSSTNVATAEIPQPSSPPHQQASPSSSSSTDTVMKDSPLPGIKLPKSTIQWSEANAYFHSQRSALANIADIDNFTTSFQTLIYNYFLSTYVTIK